MRDRYATRSLVPETQTLTPPRAVEGSDGLLLEVDGQVVPNYDATLVPFEEGDVVSGKVVRIDQDEVLVDIGYKSEGVILSNELSIRKSVDPADEVELGEEVDAHDSSVHDLPLDDLGKGSVVVGDELPVGAGCPDPLFGGSGLF